MVITVYVLNLFETDEIVFAIAGPSVLNSSSDPVRKPNATEAAFRRLSASSFNSLESIDITSTHK